MFHKIFLLPALFAIFFYLSAKAQVRIPVKATVSCQHCDFLKAKASIIENSIEGKDKTSDKIFKAIDDTKEALAVFLISAGNDLSEKEIEALIFAWSTVSTYDVYFSIPQAPGVSDKLSDTTFDKIQTITHTDANRYCQPQMPCPISDQIKKRALISISVAITKMLAQKKETSALEN